MTKLTDKSDSMEIQEWMDKCRRLESCRALAARMAEIPPETLPAPDRFDWLRVTAWAALFVVSWGIVLAWALLT